MYKLSLYAKFGTEEKLVYVTSNLYGDWTWHMDGFKISREVIEDLETGKKYETIREKRVDFDHNAILNDLLNYKDPGPLKFMDVECECGKDKHGFIGHSDWCPKENYD